MSKHTPTKIQLHKKSKTLELHFNDREFVLSAEYLRVFSPSAEVKGHGPGQETLQTGKQEVGIKQVQSTGTYAIRLIFDDNHDSGLYTWDYLYELGEKQQSNWQDYLARLNAVGASRDPNISAVKFIDAAAKK